MSVEAEVTSGTPIQAPASNRISGYTDGAYRNFTASHRPATVAVFVQVRPGSPGAELPGGFVLELASQPPVDGYDMEYHGYGKPLVRVGIPESSHLEPAVGRDHRFRVCGLLVHLGSVSRDLGASRSRQAEDEWCASQMVSTNWLNTSRRNEV